MQLINYVSSLAYLHTLWVAFACSCRIYMPPIKSATLRYTMLRYIKCIRRVGRFVADAFFARQKARWTYSKGNPAKYRNDVRKKIQSEKQVYTCHV